MTAAEPAEARRLWESARQCFETAGETRAAARVSGRIGALEVAAGRPDEAIARLERALAVVGDAADADAAEVAVRLGSAYLFAGLPQQAAAPVERALQVAEALRLPDVLCRALMSKAWISGAGGRPEEAFALLRHALRHALENDVTVSALVAYSNVADACYTADRYGEALEHLGDALPYARRIGARRNELTVVSALTYGLAMTGRWEESLATFAELPDEKLQTESTLTSPLCGVLEVYLHRGRLEDAERLFALYDRLDGTTADAQSRVIRAGAMAAMEYARGRPAEALDAGAATLGAFRTDVGIEGAKQGFVWAVEAALSLGKRERADELLRIVDALPPGLRPPFAEAHAHRFRARLDGREAGFKSAAALFREHDLPFWLAVTLLEHGEWLAGEARSAEAERLLAEARDIFERLEAAPWLERVRPAGRVEAPA